jgi:hypothetical protein
MYLLDFLERLVAPRYSVGFHRSRHGSCRLERYAVVIVIVVGVEEGGYT